MNSCYLCHLITFLCFLVCSQTQLHFCFILFHLFWRVNQMTENRRRFASKVGHLWYFMTLSHCMWEFVVERCPSGPQNDSRTAR